MSYEVSRHNTGVISSYEEFRCGLCSKVFSQCECTMVALSIHVGHTAGVSEERANRMDILGKAKNAKYATKTAARKAYYELHPERVAASNKAYRARVKAGLVGTVKIGRPKIKEELLARQRAHSAVARGLLDGRLVRPNRCSDCNKKCEPEAHHDDYSKPFDVRWLCRQCHRRHHGCVNGSVPRADVKTGRPTSRPSTGVVKTTQGGTPQKVVPDLEPTTGSGAVVKKTQVTYQMAHEWSMEPQGPKTRRRGNATRKDKKLAKELGL